MRGVLSTFVSILGLIALWMWYQQSTEQTEMRIAELEHTIIEQEKLILELTNPPVKPVSTKPYTYDQWVGTCPPGKDGPLCNCATC